MQANIKGAARRVIVIGAGPAGLSCAVGLADAGYQPLVLESGARVGGLSRSLDLFGQRVDLGPHRFFSSNPSVTRFWRRFVDSHTEVERLTRIYYRGKYYHYPIQSVDALTKLGPFEAARCLGSYAATYLRSRDGGDSLESWVVSRFGRRLFEIFFKTYSERLWGIPCSEIDADWAAQRIKKFSLGEAVRSAVSKKKGQHATLLDRFVYPDQGTGSVYENMSRHVSERGGTVLLNTPVAAMESEGSRVVGVRTHDGQVYRADHVVSTMPLTSMVKGFKDVPEDVARACSQLIYRNTILVFLEIDSASLFRDNWLYIHSPDVLHGRVTNFRNWSPKLYGEARTTILCVEYWCFDHEELWSRSDRDLTCLADHELRRTGLVPSGARLLHGHVERLRRSYPVYKRGYRVLLEKVQRFVDSHQGLLAIGRYGAFKYNNQDHSILMGMLAAKEIVTGERQRLWEVNADSEYQESAGFDELSGALTPPP